MWESARDSLDTWEFEGDTLGFSSSSSSMESLLSFLSSFSFSAFSTVFVMNFSKAVKEGSLGPPKEKGSMFCWSVRVMAGVDRLLLLLALLPPKVFVALSERYKGAWTLCLLWLPKGGGEPPFLGGDVLPCSEIGSGDLLLLLWASCSRISAADLEVVEDHDERRCFGRAGCTLLRDCRGLTG